MTDNLRSRIQEEMKDAMRAKDAIRLGTIRLLLAAIKQREVDERIVLNDVQIIAVVDKMIKQRLDSVEQYQKGNRQDLVAIETNEINLLKTYLPQPLTDSELENLIKEAMAAVSATSIKDMAKVMSYIKNIAQGRADMAKVSNLVKEIITG